MSNNDNLRASPQRDATVLQDQGRALHQQHNEAIGLPNCFVNRSLSLSSQTRSIHADVKKTLFHLTALNL